MAQRWLALHSAPLHTPSPLLALPFRRLSTPPSSLSPANFAWQSIVLRWSDLPDPIRQAFHTQAAPSLQLAATQTLQSANISALLPFLVAAAEPPLRLLALDKFAKAFEADPQSLAALTRSAAADVDQPALAAAARGVIYHHSITPVEIALALADRRTLRTGGALATWLAAEAAVGAGSIRAAIRRSTDDSAWLRALELVPNPAWKSAALQKLSSSPNPIQFTELVSAGHLLENPHRAASLRSALRAKPIEAFLPSASRRLVGSGAIRWATLKPRLPEALSQRIALDALARLTATRLRAPLSPELKHEPETHPAVIQSQFLNLSPAGTLHECTRAASPRPPQSQPVPAPSPFEHWSREDSLLTSQ
ncbi:MAG: hypothetical protein PSX37_11450, partial [bacterium]|nr:hypothetical protein [bacterium]